MGEVFSLHRCITLLLFPTGAAGETARRIRQVYLQLILPKFLLSCKVCLEELDDLMNPEVKSAEVWRGYYRPADKLRGNQSDVLVAKLAASVHAPKSTRGTEFMVSINQLIFNREAEYSFSRTEKSEGEH